jgi:hypothetical protein
MKLLSLKTLLAALCLMSAITLAACTSDTGTNTNNTAASNTATVVNSNTTTTASNTTAVNSSTAPANTSATTTTASTGGKTGVAECDDYLEKYEACLNAKVPEAGRATLKASFETTRKSWNTAAATPEGRAGLAQACKAAKDAAKQSMAAYGCSW